MFTSLSNQEKRFIPNNIYTSVKPWQQVIADRVVNNPYPFLLNHNELENAKGGNFRFCLQMLGMGLGAISVMILRKNIPKGFSVGSLRAADWFWLTLAGFAGQRIGNLIGINLFGDYKLYYAHMLAYEFVKTNNRFEGRDVLSKPPMMF